MGARIVTVNKDGRKVMSYTVVSGDTEYKMSKDEVIKAINGNQIDNAKIQWYEGKPIIRIKDGVAVQNRRGADREIKEVSHRKKVENIENNQIAQTPENWEKALKNVKLCIDSTDSSGNMMFKKLMIELGANKKDIDSEVRQAYMLISQKYDMQKQYSLTTELVEIIKLQNYITEILKGIVFENLIKIANKYTYKGLLKQPYKYSTDSDGEQFIDLANQ